MKTLQAYYNGNSIQTVENYKFKKNQKLLITVLNADDEQKKTDIKTLKGSLSKYANPKLIEKESDAWSEAVKEKYDLC